MPGVPERLQGTYAGLASEAAVQASGAVDRALATLQEKGLIYQGALERPKQSLLYTGFAPAERPPRQ